MFAGKARAVVQGMQAYVAGRPIEEVQRELGVERLVKLASNENPRGPSPVVVAAAQQALSQIHRYPDSNGYYLKQKLAQWHGVSADCITLGNGSNDILELVASAYLEKGDSAVYSQYGFIVYPLAIARSGATAVVVPAKAFGHDLSAMVKAIDETTKVVYIANPNNPTGTYVGAAELQTFLKSVPATTVVVLDEAYVEYAEQDDYPDGIALLSAHPNLVVTRTFSKAYGMSGLRVGYGVCDPKIADMLNRVRQPFNVTLPSLAAAVAAIDDRDYIAQSASLNRNGMAALSEGFSQLGFDYIESAANFITFNTGEFNTAALNDRLLRKGVIVRPLANYGLNSWLRVSIGVEQENAFFLQQLAAVRDEMLDGT